MPLPGVIAAAPPEGTAHPLDLTAVYEQTADFTWRTLQRLGIPESDLEDVLQEVYVVVHRRLASYDGKCKVTTWLFGICMRVASRHRRRAWFRRERPTESLPHQSDERTPEECAARHEAVRQLESILAGLSLERRAAFVLFELDGMSCQDIAELTAVPVGTVYSRLHAARKHVQKAAARLRGRDATGVRP